MYSLWYRFPLRISIFSRDILARYVDTVLRPIFPYKDSYCFFTSSDVNQTLGYSNLKNISNLSFKVNVLDSLILFVIGVWGGISFLVLEAARMNFIADITGNSPSNSASAFVPSSLTRCTCTSSASIELR